MIKMYNTDMETNITEEVNEFKKGNWINMIAPTEEEIEKVCKKIKILSQSDKKFGIVYV